MSEPLVTAGDLDGDVCSECLHLDISHIPEQAADGWGMNPWGCRRTQAEVRLGHLESVVRREVAKALREFAVEQQQYVWKPSDTRRLPEDEQAAYVVGAGDAHAVVERLADERADAIESGGQS